jgi:acyl-CoA thioester hydrolase
MALSPAAGDNLICIEISSGRARRMPAEFCDVYPPAVVAAA